MKNLITRSLSGIVYVGLIVAAILAGNYWMLWLVMLLSFLAISEFNVITNGGEHPDGVIRFIDLFTCGVVLLIPYVINCISAHEAIYLIPAVILLLMGRLIAALYIKEGNQLSLLAHSLMAQIYITFPLFLLLNVYYLAPKLVLLMFVMIWLSDTGAFCVGSLFGKRKLFERISPHKSWEGFFGGMLFSIAAGCIAFAVWGTKYFTGFTAVELAIFGAVVAIFATWGDLIESLIKRTLKIKDSGSLIPGHGGILDRIDSLLLVAPATTIYLLILMFLKS